MSYRVFSHDVTAAILVSPKAKFPAGLGEKKGRAVPN